jgi:hypothetical protein
VVFHECLKTAQRPGRAEYQVSTSAAPEKIVIICAKPSMAWWFDQAKCGAIFTDIIMIHTRATYSAIATSPLVFLGVRAGNLGSDVLSTVFY